MRATILCVVLVSIGFEGVVQAQPALTPPSLTPPAASGPPLTADDQRVLDQGEISVPRHLGGLLLAVYPGFGIGQAVQKRWRQTGWIITVGEGAGAVLFTYGLADVLGCQSRPCSSGDAGGVALVTGLIVAGAFYLGGIVDALVGPIRHNDRVHALRRRLTPYATAPSGGHGTIAGVALRF